MGTTMIEKSKNEKTSHCTKTSTTIRKVKMSLDVLSKLILFAQNFGNYLLIFQNQN